MITKSIKFFESYNEVNTKFSIEKACLLFLYSFLEKFDSNQDVLLDQFISECR